MKRKELTEQAYTYLHEKGQLDDYNHLVCFALWHLLSGGAKDTLIALVKNGPLYDGDVPSKAGRDELIDLGLCGKAVVKGEHGYQVANYRGWQVAQAQNLE